MKCREVLELLPRHFDGEVEAPRAAEVDAHVRSCSSCAGALEALRRGEEAVRALPDQGADPSHLEALERDILRAVRSASAGAPGPAADVKPRAAGLWADRPRAGIAIAASAAAALALVLALGFALGGRKGPPVAPSPAKRGASDAAGGSNGRVEASAARKAGLASTGQPDEKIYILLDAAEDKVREIRALAGEGKQAELASAAESYCRIVGEGILSTLDAGSAEGEEFEGPTRLWRQASKTHCKVFEESVCAVSGEARTALETAIGLCHRDAE